MRTSITVAGRYNGPRDNGQGGYTAGLLAAELDVRAAAVSLRSPVPLDRPLELRSEDGGARLLDGEALIAEAEPAQLDLEAPEPVRPAEAAAARRGYRGEPGGLFSDCFVCGLAREDAFGVQAGPVEGRDVVATPWTPHASLAGGHGGAVRPEFVWAALDCPTYFAAYRGEEGRISFLARIAAQLDTPVPTGAEQVVMAWPLGASGRKREAGAALVSADGGVLARARVLMIEPRG